MAGDAEVAELMVRVAAMRAAMGKLRADLDVLVEAEHALGEKLRAMGLDDAQTTVDLPTIPGLPSRRKRGSEAPAPIALSPMRAAMLGAGLTLGLAFVILLVVNIQISRSMKAAEPAPPPTVTGLVVMSPSAPPPIPAPEPIVSAAPSASVDAKPEMGAITIVCTPRCDSITDNGTPLSPGNLVAVPVPVGPHKIVVAGNGKQRTFSITIAPGQTRDLHASFESQSVDRGF